MADDLRVRIVWTNDEVSLRAAMQQAQQLLQGVQGSVGYGAGTVAGAPTPATLAAMGAIRAQAPTGLLNARGQPIGGGANAITAPPPVYGSPAAPPGGPPAPPGAPAPPAAQPFGGNRQGFGNRLGGVFGYFGRSILVRGAFSAVGAIGEAAQQQQQLSDMNRRVGDGVQQWRQFEDSILKVGVGLGATRQQMIELTNTFVSSVGKMGTEQTAQTVRGGMMLAKTMGIAPESVIGFESNTARFLQGPNTDFNKLGATLYTAVSKGMQGREEEVIKAIDSLTEIVGSRLPDFGPEGIGGIATLLGALSSTGIQGFMGQRGAQVAGTLDSFISGQGSDAQKMIAWGAVARQRQAAGLPIGITDIGLQMERGVNDPNNVKAIQDLLKQFGSGPMAIAMGTTLGLTLNQSKKLIESGFSNMDLAGAGAALKTIPGYEQAQPDKNTESMASAGRAMTELGEKLVGIVAPAMDVLAHQMGLLTAAMVVFNLTGGLAGVKGIGSAVQGAGGALAAGGLGGIGVAMGIGAAAGGALSLGYDKLAHPGEPTTIDLALQAMGINFLPGQAQGLVRRGEGGLVTSPEVALLGEAGPEMVVPMNAEGIGRMMSSMLGGTGDAWKAFAAQYGIETAWGKSMYGNNPFNLRPIAGGWGGQTGIHHSGASGDFAAFGSIEAGIRAAAGNYLVGNYGYGAVVSAARSGNPLAVARAIEASSWDAGHYGYGNLSNMVGGSMPAGNVVGGGTVNHELTVTIKNQQDGSIEKFKKSLTDRTAVTSPNWGVAY